MGNSTLSTNVMYPRMNERFGDIGHFVELETLWKQSPKVVLKINLKMVEKRLQNWPKIGSQMI